MDILYKDLKMFRNLSIAQIVLSALGMVAGFFCLAIGCMGYALAPEMGGAFTYDGDYIDPEMTMSGYQQTGTMSTEFAMGLLIVASVLLIAATLFCLIVGAMGMSPLKQGGRLRKLFVLDIAAAIVAGLFGGIVSMVIFIILAVLVCKLRDVPYETLSYVWANPRLFNVQPGYASQPVSPIWGQQPGAPMGQQPGVPGGIQFGGPMAGQPGYAQPQPGTPMGAQPGWPMQQPAPVAQTQPVEQVSAVAPVEQPASLVPADAATPSGQVVSQAPDGQQGEAPKSN